MVWQKNGTPDTVSGGASTMSISDLTAVKSNEFLTHQIQNGNVLNHRIDSISTSTYAERFSDNGGTDTTNVSQTELETATSGTSDEFCNMFGVNIGTEEKLFIANIVGANTAGAGTAPRRREYVGKQSGTTTAYTSIETTLTAANDSNLSALADVVVVPAAVGGWVEVGRTTLGVAADTITVSGLTDKRYYMVLQSITRSGGLSPDGTRLGNGSADSGNNYATRYSNNGGADVPNTNNNQAIDYTPSVSNDDSFAVQYISNLSGNEKLWIKQRVGRQAVGAGTAPNRSENYAKWVNTSNPMDVFQTTNVADVGSYESGSEAVVLGWDPTDTHTNNFWEELFSETLTSNASGFSTGPISAKKYLWLQFYQVGMTGNSIWTFNSDTSASYARRHEINGGADATVVNQTNLINVLTGGTGDLGTLTNAFIVNNSANEKLITFSTTFFVTSGAGTAPQRIEGVCKWDDVAAQITSIQVNDTGTGFNAPSFLKIWGAD